MPLVKAANPKEIFGADDWAAITHVSNVRGIWLVVHAWLVIAIVALATAWLWQWNWAAGLAATPFALALLGGRQLGLSILMHDAAHGCLHRNRKFNNWLGQFAGAATGTDVHSYRAYHLTHHKYTQQPEDPDLDLSKPFPATPASMKRKVIRDLTGQTFFKQRSHQAIAAWKGLMAILQNKSTSEKPTKKGSALAMNAQSRNGVNAPVVNLDDAKITAKTFGRFILCQLVVLAVSLATLGWIPFLLWIVALATSFQLVLRIRNIAEHACTPTGSEDPFTHARTTYANWFARAVVAPYWVNYHAEHHLFMAVPCYHLRNAHRLLGEKGHYPRMKIAPNYRAVMREVVAT